MGLLWAATQPRALCCGLPCSCRIHYGSAVGCLTAPQGICAVPCSFRWLLRAATQLRGSAVNCHTDQDAAVLRHAAAVGRWKVQGSCQVAQRRRCSTQLHSHLGRSTWVLRQPLQHGRCLPPAHQCLCTPAGSACTLPWLVVLHGSAHRCLLPAHRQQTPAARVCTLPQTCRAACRLQINICPPAAGLSASLTPSDQLGCRRASNLPSAAEQARLQTKCQPLRLAQAGLQAGPLLNFSTALHR